MTLARLCTAIGIAVSLIYAGARTQDVQAAASLFLQQRCEPDGSVSLAFMWEGNDPRATQQWLDVSQVSNGWQQGSFISAGPLTGTTMQYIWPGWRPNTAYYARVNQQLANGIWESSITYRVEVQGCGVAVPPSSPPVPQPALPPYQAANSQPTQPAQVTTQSAAPLLQIASLSSPLNRGNTANLNVSTLPSASCSLAYTDPSGLTSNAQDLDPKDADSTGMAQWNWLIARDTMPGNGTITVTCAGQAVRATIQITG